MKEPIITEILGGYEFEYIEESLAGPVIRLRNICRDRNGQLVAELDAFCQEPDIMIPVEGIRFNISSLSQRERMARGIKASYESVDATYIDWQKIINDVSWRAREFYLDGGGAEEIWPSEDSNLAPDYLLEPILYLNHPTVIFGDYGSLKSLASLAIAYMVQLPFHDNTLGLITGKESSPCLYLDYEDDKSSFQRRWSALDRGFGKGATPISYKRMTEPLADSVEPIAKAITKNNIKLLIIDSLGPAARGNLNDPEPAIRYHAALRELGITSLTLAHNSKDQLTKRRTIFGSVFFTNLARSVWECKAEQETGEDEAIISLRHTKANLSWLHPPLGFRFNFTADTITIVQADLKDTSLSGELPLSWQIKNLLREGPLAVKDIASALGSSEDTTGRTLRRMKGKDQVIKLEDNTWGLCLE
jgi:hypothetical protein